MLLHALRCELRCQCARCATQISVSPMRAMGAAAEAAEAAEANLLTAAASIAIVVADGCESNLDAH